MRQWNNCQMIWSNTINRSCLFAGIVGILLFTVNVQALSQLGCCSDGYGLNYTLPMFDVCRKTQHDGSMVHTIPKLIPAFPAQDTRCRRKNKLGIPPGQRVCHIPDCLEVPCQQGWCEESMTGHQCHCPEGFFGDFCEEYLVGSTQSGHEHSQNTSPSVITTSRASVSQQAIELTTDSSQQPTTKAITTTDHQTTLILEPLGTCPDDWIEVQNSSKCYYFFAPSLYTGTWYEGRNACADINITTPNGDVIHPQLLVLQSIEEMIEFGMIIDLHHSWLWSWTSGRFWLNCNDIDEEGTFYCDQGGDMIPLSNSTRDFQQLLGGFTNAQDCLIFYRYTMMLKDRRCDYESLIVCEIRRF